MSDTEVSPEIAREPNPRVRFDFDNSAALEALAWTDGANQYFFSHRFEYGHYGDEPFSVFYGMIDGSSRSDGNFGFSATLLLDQISDIKVMNALRDFTNQSDPLHGDRSYEFYFQTDEGYWYEVRLNDDRDAIEIRTLGRENEDNHDLNLVSRSLRHGVDGFEDSLNDFLTYSENVVNALYRLMGAPEDLVEIECKPLSFGQEKADVVLRGGSAEGLTPEVSLDDIVGIDSVISAIRDVVDAYRASDVMFAHGVRSPRSILLHGPPGTGKTTIVRAMANELGAKLREVNCVDIYDLWLGNSEKALNALFSEVEATTEPLVVFLDEFDGVISSRDHQATSQRVTSLLKQRLANLSEANPLVIVAAATNHIDRIDGALLRAGRFDVKKYVPLPELDGRAKIFAYHIGLFFRAPEQVFDFPIIDYDRLAQASEGFSGADIEKIMRATAMAIALQKIRTKNPELIAGTDMILRFIAKHREDMG